MGIGEVEQHEDRIVFMSGFSVLMLGWLLERQLNNKNKASNVCIDQTVNKDSIFLRSYLTRVFPSTIINRQSESGVLDMQL